jgi:hypothetical protein
LKFLLSQKKKQFVWTFQLSLFQLWNERLKICFKNLVLWSF